MLTLKTIGVLALAAGLIFLVWKFIRWIIVALVIAGLLLVAYYVKFHHLPTFIPVNLFHR